MEQDWNCQPFSYWTAGSTSLNIFNTAKAKVALGKRDALLRVFTSRSVKTLFVPDGRDVNGMMGSCVPSAY